MGTITVLNRVECLLDLLHNPKIVLPAQAAMFSSFWQGNRLRVTRLDSGLRRMTGYATGLLIDGVQ